MSVIPEDLTVFCQDVDTLTTRLRQAKRFTFVPPAAGTAVVLVHDGNPLLVRIVKQQEQVVVGEIMHVALPIVLSPGMQVRGTYGQNSCEWYCEGHEGLIALEDYRQVIVDQAKYSKWFYRLGGLKRGVKCNNASMNVFLKQTTGQAPLTQICTLLETLTWSKKKGEMLYFSLLVFNLALFLPLTLMPDTALISLLINGGCTLYSLHNWYKDVRLQRRMQKKFNTYWPECQQEYQKLRDMITRYGLSPNRIQALKKWVLVTMSRLDYNLMPDLEALPKAWTLTLLHHIDKLDMEDSATEQTDHLDTLWSLMDHYNKDISCFQTTVK